MLAEIHDVDVVGQLVLDEFAGRVRQEHLAAVPGRADARAAVDAHPDIPVATDKRLARVKAHPHANRHAVGPRLGGERPLQLDRRGDRVACARERDEERVALRVDLVAVEPLDRLADQPGMGLKHIVVALAELLEQPRRSFDVGEEEGDGAGRTLGHHDDPEPCLSAGQGSARR